MLKYHLGEILESRAKASELREARMELEGEVRAISQREVQTRSDKLIPIPDDGPCAPGEGVGESLL